VLIKYFSEQNIRQYLLKNSHTLIPEWENIMSICKDIKFNNFSVDFYSDLERHPKFNNDIDHLLKTNINIAHQNIQDYINNSVKLSSLSLLLGYMFSKLNVPFYIIMNKLDFGKTNIIINNLIPFYRDKIAKRFSISLNDDDFSQHIEHFQKIRNKIAHHEPLCKSKFDPIKNFSNFSNFNNDLINSHKNLIIFYLDMIAPRNTLNDKISNLIIQYKKRYNIDFTAWGFDNNTTI
jgi:abortive infection bacteriophage resistance protein